MVTIKTLSKETLKNVLFQLGLTSSHSATLQTGVSPAEGLRMEGLSTKQKISAWQDCHGCMPGADHCPALTIKAQIWQNMSVKLFHIGLSGGLQDECSTIPPMASTSQVENQKQNKIHVAFCHRQLISACFILLLRLNPSWIICNPLNPQILKKTGSHKSYSASNLGRLLCTDPTDFPWMLSKEGWEFL